MAAIRTFILFIYCFAASFGLMAQNATNRPVTPADSMIPADSGKKAKLPYEHQIKIAFDLARVAFNFATPSRTGFEFQADYLLRKNVYLNAEAGFGRGKVDYDFLKYNTNGAFFKLGAQKSMVDRLNDKDFDVVFFGLNYGTSFGSRGEADYVVTSQFGTITEGTFPAAGYWAHWGEMVAGVRVEFLPHVFAGWNARAKFLFNAASFQELSPNFIPGYGRGDKTTIFDFNFYICYALRWGKTSP